MRSAHDTSSRTAMTANLAPLPLPPLDPARTILFVCDMQNGFVKPGGSISKLGLPTDRTVEPIAPIKRMISAFRDVGAPVLFSQMWLRADYTDAGILAEVFPPLKGLGHCVAETWDAEIISELAPEPNDYIVRKTRFDAFHGTNLELTLRCLGIEQIVMVGIATNVCVEATVRGAFSRDFRVLLAVDATASYTKEMEEASLGSMGFGFARLTDVESVLAALAAGARGRGLVEVEEVLAALSE